MNRLQLALVEIELIISEVVETDLNANPTIECEYVNNVNIT